MLDFDDIQGNILAGFNTDFQVLVAFTFRGNDWQPVCQWLASLAPDVTSVTQVRQHRDRMKAAVIQNDTWLCVAVGERLMRMTQPDVIFSDDAFRKGMIRRAGSVLGDKTDAKLWKLGAVDNEVDVLLLTASNIQSAAVDRANQLMEAATAVGLTMTYRENGNRLDGREHFGFRDGISQPQVVDSDENGSMHPGNFVYGYPKFDGGPPVTVHTDPREVTRNGSLLVIRRLLQDVGGFINFFTEHAAILKPQWPAVTPELLQALVVGRWPSGALVDMFQTSDPGSTGSENSFDFSDDMDGKRCPLGAHIRKVNPRKGKKDRVDIPRFLRRGIPFGPLFQDDPAAERGLLFLSYQTSITDSFEFITGSWMNSFGKPASNAGHDLLVGRANERSLPLNTSLGSLLLDDGGINFITPSGGAYLFAPSKSGLQKLSSQPVLSIRTRINKTVFAIKDMFN